jgi:hypothetical protein
MKEAMNLIERFINTHPIDGREISIYDTVGNGRWTIYAEYKDMVAAMEAFLYATRAIVSNMAIDATGTRYTVTLQYTSESMRSGVYTYNAAKRALE